VRPQEEQWGGSDEEPDESQKELMRRTAVHILTSPNPAQLEMRILANHGADARFAFLRGRWSRAWKITKGRVRLEKEQDAKKAAPDPKPTMALGGLTGYGDSDAEDDEDDEVAGAPANKGEEKTCTTVAATVHGVEDPPTESAEEAAKKARRERAREWAEKRRAAKGATEDTGDT